MSRVLPSAVRTAFFSLALTALFGVASGFAGTDVGSINFTFGYKNLVGEWNLEPTGVDENGQPLPAERTYYPSDRKSVV